MPVIYQTLIKRADLQANPDVLYVFGDNMRRSGLGGQAAEMRGEPNAVGIPTKWKASWDESAFFDDKKGRNTIEIEILRAFGKLSHHHKENGIIVWPLGDIGTGRAQLQERAPEIWKFIQDLKKTLGE